MLKGHFSRAIDKDERISESRSNDVNAVYGTPFFGHLINDQNDF